MKKNKFTGFNLIFFIASFGCLFVLAAVVIIVDPLFHYHAPIGNMRYILYEERYQNDGISKFFDYDALLTGTSMVENTLISDVNDAFGVNAVKTCYMGGSYSEIDSNIRVALEHNPNLKTVLRATDQFDVIRDADFHISTDPARNYDYPWYLVNDNPFDDVKYIFNKKLLEATITDAMWTLKDHPSTTFDEYGYWANLYTFSKDTVLSSYAKYDVNENVTPFTDEDRQTVYENVTRNVINTAKEHPDVTFYIWIPPYSIAYYDEEHRSGNLARDLDAMEYELELLTSVDNIKAFAFADRYDIVENLDLYKDVQHYAPSVNAELIRCMADEKGLITADNYKEYMSQIRDHYLNYDYNSIY